MNQPNSSVRCPNCNLLNFASDQFCKRCKNSLQANNSAVDPNTINININLSTPVQPRFNVSHNNQPTNNFPPPPSFGQNNQAQLNQRNYQSYGNNEQSGEYKLQNQAGFQQWQQDNAQANPNTNNHTNNYTNNSQFPVPVYPPNYYPANVPAVWRRGSEVVVHRHTGVLPDGCVKCGAQLSGYAGGGYVRQKYRWHHPAVYVALISPLIYCILAAVLSQRAAVEIPLCRQHLEKRNSAGRLLIGGGIAAIIAVLMSFSLGYVGFGLLIFLGSLISIVLGYEYSYKPLQISKIESDHVYLKNADSEFLNRLPHC